MVDITNLFKDENAMKSNFITWGKPGDFVVGTLLSKRQVENNISGKSVMQTIYEFKVQEGLFHTLDERKNPVEPAVIMSPGEVYNVGGKLAVDAQMRNIRIGAILGMKFLEEKPSKTKGYNPTKVIKVYFTGQVDTDYLKEVREQESQIAMQMKLDEEFNS